MNRGAGGAGGGGGSGGGSGGYTLADKGKVKFHIAISLWAALNIAGAIGLAFLSSKLPLSTRLSLADVVPSVFVAVSLIGFWLVLRLRKG